MRPNVTGNVTADSFWSMGESLSVHFTVVYEQAADGWFVARVPERPGAVSQGATRSEARDNVRDALRELLAHEHDSVAGEHGDSETLELVIAP